MKDMFQMFQTGDRLTRRDRFALIVLDRLMGTMPAASTSPDAIPRIAAAVYQFADALEAEAKLREGGR